MHLFLDIFEKIFGDVKALFLTKLTIFLVVLVAFEFFFPNASRYLLSFFWQVFYITFLLWLPLILGMLFWIAWLRYIRANFLADPKQASVLLEVRLPQLIDRSPKAMELALTAIHHTGGQTSWYDVYILGKSRPEFSLEIASIEGQVKFFIRSRAFYKDAVEAALYSQYPGIEIHEVPDYTEEVPHFDYNKIAMHSFEYKYPFDRKEKKTFHAYPIRTYIDFELDKDPKEEFKVDPITPVLEFMGSLGPGEQLWLQFIIRAYKEPQTKPGSIFKPGPIFKVFDFKKEGEADIKKLRDRLKQSKATLQEGQLEYSRIPSKEEAERISDVDRKLGKQIYEVAVRSVYIAKPPENFKPRALPIMAVFFRGVAYPGLNSISIDKDTSIDFPWQDFNNFRANGKRRRFLEAYRRRAAYFQHTNDIESMFMSAEELATIYHFPGQVAGTPGLDRITSKKAAPPADLPR